MSGPSVSVRDVCVTFGQYRALVDINLDVEAGEFVAIIGPNGAGKSTLLNAVLGIQPVNSGVVLLAGAPPADFPGAALGYIPQIKTLDRSFPGKAIELVVTGLRRGWPWRVHASERSVALEMMRRTGVAHVADRPIARLSGGELQRVFLTRTLVRRPTLMVLDEPAAGMDVAGEADMYHILDEYRRETGATILMITHDWEGARYHASKVLLLNRELLGFGPPAEVAREENLLRAFGHVGHVRATHGNSHDA